MLISNDRIQIPDFYSRVYILERLLYSLLIDLCSHMEESKLDPKASR